MTTKRSAVHDTFTLERTYDAAPSRVFQAWADPKQKAKWFSGPPGWKQLRPLFSTPTNFAWMPLSAAIIWV